MGVKPKRGRWGKGTRGRSIFHKVGGYVLGIASGRKIWQRTSSKGIIVKQKRKNAKTTDQLEQGKKKKHQSLGWGKNAVKTFTLRPPARKTRREKEKKSRVRKEKTERGESPFQKKDTARGFLGFNRGKKKTEKKGALGRR